MDYDQPEVETMLQDLNQDPNATVQPDAGTVDVSQVEPGQASGFNPQDFGYVFRSEMQYPKSKEELIELMQLGHSYKNNRQKFEDERKSFSEKMNGLSKYEKLEQALNTHPELSQQIWSAYQQYVSGRGGATAQRPPQPNNSTQTQPNAYDPRIDHVTGEVERLKQAQADAELAKEIDSVKSKYPNHNWEKDLGEGTFKRQLLSFMQRENIYNVEHAYKALAFEDTIKQTQFKAGQNTTQQIQNSHKKGVVSKPGNGKPAAGPVDVKGKSYDQVMEMALEEFGIKN